ncbi:MAG: FecR domain-containing protein [Novosphingobium sp.]
MTSLREEAAEWFALMRGPDAELRRPEFEAWLARDAIHRDAYNRIGEVFSLGKGLKASGQLERAEDRDAPVRGRSVAPVLRFALVAACLALGLLQLTTMALRQVRPDNPFLWNQLPPVRADLATRRGEIRTIDLADGSRLTLDTDTLVEVDFSAVRRDLRLIRGRARFAVAHEARPFVVAAAGGSVTARGTVFDIALAPDATATVNLIEGIVDVRQPAGAGRGAGAAATTRLLAGNALAFGLGLERHKSAPPGRDDWPTGLHDFASVRLADLLREANRYAERPIVLGSPDLRDIQVSGTFNLRDGDRLAYNLADLFDLTVRDNGGQLSIERPCAGQDQNKCGAPLIK